MWWWGSPDCEAASYVNKLTDFKTPGNCAGRRSPLLLADAECCSDGIDFFADLLHLVEGPRQ